MSDLPFGPVGGPRRPCQWAALHAGVEFMTAQERDVLEARQSGLSVEYIGKMMGLDPLEVDRVIGRVCRTLATWERNACQWATRYVAIEPNVADLGDNRERPSQQRPGHRKALTGVRL